MGKLLQNNVDTRVRAAAAVSLLAALLSGAGVSAQSYPTKPVRVITSGAGGTNDVISRLLAAKLMSPLGQPVVVENRGSGFIAIENAASAVPDGHTLLVFGNPLWIAPFLQKTSYDPVRDFAPISALARAPNVLVVHPSLPVNSVNDLIALAKAKPGQLNYSSASTGGSTHMAAELFKAMAGVDIVRIPYNSGNIQMQDLVGGRVQLTFGSPAVVLPLVKSGKLRALGVSTAKPTPLMPGLPTIAASGLPGYESSALWGLLSAAKTPTAVIRRLNQEIASILQVEDTKEKLLNVGVEAVTSTPAEFGAMIKADMSTSGKVIKDAGIKAD